MDILVKLKDCWINIVADLPPTLTSFVLRMGILLAIAGVLLAFAWRYLPFRSTFSQAVVTLVAITIALYVPVESFRKVGKGGLAFGVTLSILCLIFLPNLLPFFLTPKLGSQARLKKIIMAIVWGLAILQVITR